MVRLFCAVLSQILLLSAASASDPASRQPVAKLLSAPHVPGELVVKLAPVPGVEAKEHVKTVLQAKLGQMAVKSVHSLQTDPSIQVVRLRDGDSLSSALGRLRADDNVLVAEPNFIYRAYDAVPNDAAFGQLWGIQNTGQKDSAGQLGKPGADIGVVPVWQQGFYGSRSVVVAVIDTGIDWDHPDLAGNVYTNSKEIAGNGKDDDGNGFVDDIHGWNFSANTATSRDDNKHGTHVAGTIGARGNNTIGVAGVNWEVSLLPVKFLDSAGSGTLENAVNAINYATKMKVNIMSNSWGGGGFSDTLLQAIQAARAQGILFVAAAGNDARNDDDVPTYPASYQADNIVAVAATDNLDKIAVFSSYGPKTVHVAAPGVNVYSTAPNNQYINLSGTSMATPHVSGIAALLMSVHPEWGYAEIKQRLISTSDPVSGLRRKVIARGRVNTYNALMGIVPPSPDPDETLWRDVAMTFESDHPYANNTRVDFPVKVNGASYIRLHFANFSMEQGYDHVLVLDPNGVVIDDLTGKGNDLVSEYYKGDSLTVRLTSDVSVTDFGFKIDKVQVIPGP